MIHQPSGGAQGQATDISIVANHILRTKEKMNKILAERTGQPLKKVSADMERDYYMTAEEALSYGIVDEIIPPKV
jgi:ATP-dependent Clp protease protease subunit